MILNIKRKDGKTEIIGGNFNFNIVESDGGILLYINDEPNYSVLKELPCYSLGGNIVYCKEKE